MFLLWRETPHIDVRIYILLICEDGAWTQWDLFIRTRLQEEKLRKSQVYNIEK